METRSKGKKSQICSGFSSGAQKRSRIPLAEPLLPDDVIMEILSRLPAIDVVKLRMVCRKWKDLISTQYFAELHMKVKASNSPMIIVRDSSSHFYKNSDKLLVLDRGEPSRRRPTIRKVRLNFLPSFGSYLSGLSNDGLIIFHDFFSDPDSEALIMFNPITGDKVTITYPSYTYSFYGMFFNPSIKECCILLKSCESDGVVQFKILNLGPEPCCRALKQATSFVCNPRNAHIDYEPPVIIDDTTLYWLVGSCLIPHGTNNPGYPSCDELVMTFDIRTEEFNLMPHPGPIDDCDRWNHLNMHLLKIDGRLSFLHITATAMSVTINIWTLNTARLWIKSHNVVINVNQLNIAGLSVQNFKVMAAGNGELLLKCSFFGRYRRRSFCRFYACNIELGTARMIGRRTYRRSLRSTYVPNFLSLRNCEAEISI